MSERDQEDQEVIEKLKNALENQRYQYEKKLAKGSFGLVIQAKYLLEESPNLYAIKILATMKGECAKYRERELEILKGENFLHPNIAKYHKSWPMKIGDSSFMCIQMELCLSNLFEFVYDNDIVAKGGNEIVKCLIPGQPRFYEHIFPQILTGLCFIHSKGWVHRDIHPRNILIANPKPQHIADIIVKIADFGLAREIKSILVDASSTLSDDAELEELSPYVGNKLFRAPELETKHYDYKVDLYSAGVVLYFISRYLEDKKEWNEEIKQFRDGNRDSECLSHRDDKYLVFLIKQLMKGKNERPTAEKALEMAERIGKIQAKGYIETQILVEPKETDESTDGGFPPSDDNNLNLSPLSAALESMDCMQPVSSVNFGR